MRQQTRDADAARPLAGVTGAAVEGVASGSESDGDAPWPPRAVLTPGFMDESFDDERAFERDVARLLTVFAAGGDVRSELAALPALCPAIVEQTFRRVLEQFDDAVSRCGV